MVLMNFRLRVSQKTGRLGGGEGVWGSEEKGERDGQKPKKKLQGDVAK